MTLFLLLPLDIGACVMNVRDPGSMITILIHLMMSITDIDRVDTSTLTLQTMIYRHKPSKHLKKDEKTVEEKSFPKYKSDSKGTPEYNIPIGSTMVDEHLEAQKEAMPLCKGQSLEMLGSRDEVKMALLETYPYWME
ncbi:hypothetical protein DY000_02001324 [Brassica cretica]|uniref:Uncharacterized protein n=1 Tax=Brassica cretica TaxID=69181 RepID=A0ABQ7C2B6_BRACR|nr:hypothetical protein DY000_02001324 [Brassica cretica]